MIERSKDENKINPDILNMSGITHKKNVCRKKEAYQIYLHTILSIIFPSTGKKQAFRCKKIKIENYGALLQEHVYVLLLEI